MPRFPLQAGGPVMLGTGREKAEPPLVREKL
nr:MAG TPA: hypothetical protein [Caudoviricetes sp.]